MATVAELQRRQGDLRLLIASFEARLAQRQQQLDQTRRLAAENQDTIPKIQRALARAQAEGDTARAAQIESDLRESQVAAAELSATEAQQRAALEQTQTALNDARQDLAGLETQIRAAADQGPGTVSAGATQQEAQTAQDDAAVTQRPEPPPEIINNEGRITDQTLNTVPSNAEPAETEAQVDAQAQGVLPGPPLASQAPSQAPAPGGSPPGAPPVATAPQDNNQPLPANATQAEITNRFQQPLVPRPNILDQYSSYTYSISIYLMSGERYAEMLRDQKKSVRGMQLLIQSGGADIGERNEFFDLDFYIDNLSIKSVIQGKGTRAAHNVTEMTFRITEPLGITLLSRLYRATQKYAGGGPSGIKNYAAQHYLMVIRFYGYDAAGNLVSPQPGAAAGSTDRQAISEKFIPFRFTNIKFRVANKLAEYECSAVAPQNDLNTGRARGILPFAVQVQGGTLQGLLSGPVTGFTTTAQSRSTADQADVGESPDTAPDRLSPPPTAGSIGARTITSGLEQALNQFQAGFVTQENPIFNTADRYRFRIIDNAIKNAQVRPPGATDISRTAQPQPRTAAQALEGARQSVASNSKFVSGYPGQSIVQFLDLLIRNSTYIYDQEARVETTSEGRKVQRSALTPAWYHIGLEARPLRYDVRRGDYAYEFTYTVNIYKINELVSDYFPQGRFAGAHKAYEYWFTGLNTQVLNYEQDFDYLYYLTVNSAQSPTGQQGFGRLQEVYKRSFAAQSSESKQTGADNTAEPGANAADFLYSPADLSRAKLTILGDPDWIQQGSLWAGVGNTAPETQFTNFLSDGSINYDTQEIVFSLAWNRSADYDLTTGLMTVKAQS